VNVYKTNYGRFVFTLPELASAVGLKRNNRTELKRSLTASDYFKCQLNSTKGLQTTICISADGLVKVLNHRLRSRRSTVRSRAESLRDALADWFEMRLHKNLRQCKTSLLVFLTMLWMRCFLANSVCPDPVRLPLKTMPSSTSKDQRMHALSIRSKELKNRRRLAVSPSSNPAPIVRPASTPPALSSNCVNTLPIASTLDDLQISDLSVSSPHLVVALPIASAFDSIDFPAANLLMSFATGRSCALSHSNVV